MSNETKSYLAEVLEKMDADQLKQAQVEVQAEAQKRGDTPEAFERMHEDVAGMSDSAFERWAREQSKKG